MKTHSFSGLILLMIFGLIGCHSSQNVIIDDDINRFQVPDIPILESIPVRNEANVRFPEKIKAYAVNRYKDPNDPRIMHERHVIYRKEESADWRMASNADQQILIGPTMTDSALDNKPALLEKELALEVQRHREMNLEQVKNAMETQLELARIKQLLLEICAQNEQEPVKERNADEIIY